MELTVLWLAILLISDVEGFKLLGCCILTLFKPRIGLSLGISWLSTRNLAGLILAGGSGLSVMPSLTCRSKES